MKQVLLLMVLSVSITHASSQNTGCKVLPDSLQGTYEGACKNEKANGVGKATGANTYEGVFKNGLPDGKGKYTWRNGDTYEGEFKKGLKDGYGEFHKKRTYADSVITGYWKKDIYKGEFEKPYIVHNTTYDISRLEVSKVGSADKTVTISVTLLAGGGSFASRTNKTIVTMTNYQIIRGLFLYKSGSTASNKDITIFRGVEFPFRGKFYFGTTSFEIEIFEAGEWDILVPVL